MKKNKISKEKFLEMVIQAVLNQKCGFKQGWISSLAINRELSQLNFSYPKNLYQKELLEIGYFLHPSLPQGRAIRKTVVDNGKPKIFIFRNIYRNLSVSEIVRKYENDQK